MKINSNWVPWWEFVQKIFKEALLKKRLVLDQKMRKQD
jgi:hypothetical protein